MRRALLLLYAFSGGCRAAPAAQAADEQQVAPAQHSDSMAGMEAEHAMAGMVSNEDLHLRLTPRRAATAADSARAAEVLATMRRELVKYADVSVAEADGFRQFLPGVPAPIAHFTNFRWALASRRALDPARPTSLLYQRDSTGRFTLVGAMFTAPPSTGDDELDRRLPLSGARERWRETKDGQPVFGPKSPIATREACDAVGGRFAPRLFGWMVHVMAFASGDPWNTGHH